jgi:hypothetical protein
MRRLLLIFALASCAFAQCTPVFGYGYCRVLTLAQTTANLTAFPVVTQNSSGPVLLGASRIQNASCYDVVFTSDSGGTTLIPWELEQCTQSTGLVLAWFPTNLSSTVTTTVYVSYGNAGISAAQNTGSLSPANVWDSNYKGVWHLSSTGSLVDSTGTSATLTNSGYSNATGEIDGGVTASSTSSYMSAATNVTGGSSITASAWVKTTNNTQFNCFIGQQPVDASPGLDNFQFCLGGSGTGKPRVIIWSSTSSLFASAASSVISNSTWYHLAATANSTTITLYLNGTSIATGSSSAINTNSTPITLGNLTDHTYGLVGTLDEAEYSTAVRSAAWIAAEYANQNPASIFLAVGSEVVGGTAKKKIIVVN